MHLQITEDLDRVRAAGYYPCCSPYGPQVGFAHRDGEIHHLEAIAYALGPQELMAATRLSVTLLELTQAEQDLLADETAEWMAGQKVSSDQ